MQLKLFILPVKNLAAVEAEMNAFLRSDRVLAVKKEFVLVAILRQAYTLGMKSMGGFSLRRKILYAKRTTVKISKQKDTHMIRNKLIAIFAVITMVAMIQTAQASLTLAQLAAGQTLSIDDKTFSGFSYTPSGLTSFDPSQIIVTATQSGGIDYLTWSGNISLASAGIASADLLLKYKVTANAGTINAIDQGYTGSAINGFLTVDETVSTALGGVPIVGYSHLTGLDISDPPAEGFDLLDIVPPETVLYVTKDIGFGVTSANGGFITISEVTQSFHQVVPEPTTVVAGVLLLLPLGASTLRILRKRQTA